jgi:hypothetical protein
MNYLKLNTIISRRLFDPSKEEDQQELKFFLTTGKWKNKCPFYAEFPWENIPEMCKEKFTMYQLSKI